MTCWEFELIPTNEYVFMGDGSLRPTQMPILAEGQVCICGYDQGLGEMMLLCKSLDDMQKAWDAYAQGWALIIKFYRGKQTRRFSSVEIPSTDGERLLEGSAFDDALQRRINLLAQGNMGSTRVTRDLVQQHGTEVLDMLEAQDITGSLVWRLYKYVCGQDYDETMGRLRAGTGGELVNQYRE